MDQKDRRFADALQKYVNGLFNGRGWETWRTLPATVNMALDDHNQLIVTPVETHEQDVITLEKDLKQAKKTIKQLESQISEITKEEETVVPEETPLIAEAPEPPHTGGPTATEALAAEATKRTRRKRTA